METKFFMKRESVSPSLLDSERQSDEAFVPLTNHAIAAIMKKDETIFIWNIQRELRLANGRRLGMGWVATRIRGQRCASLLQFSERAAMRLQFGEHACGNGGNGGRSREVLAGRPESIGGIKIGHGTISTNGLIVEYEYRHHHDGTVPTM